MEIVVGNRALAHIAGAAGIAGQLAASYFFLLFPAMSVPPPANYPFFIAWAVLVGVAVASWRDHPWRSFLIPIVSVPIAVLLLEFGIRFLGWAP